MQSNKRVVFPELARIGTRHARSVAVFRMWLYVGLITYSLITPGFQVAWDIANPVLTPYDQMVIVGLELVGNELRPGFKQLQLFLFECSFEVGLDCI